MKNPKENVGPRIRPETKKFYGETFSSVNAGAEYSLEMFRALYRRTLSELKGYFSADELKLILDVNNALSINPNMAGQHLPPDVSDGITLDGLDKKWSIDGKCLNEKISKLHVFQIACLEVWANGFWYSDPDKDLNIDKQVEQLA